MCGEAKYYIYAAVLKESDASVILEILVIIKLTILAFISC